MDKKFYVSWEVVNDFREDFGDCDCAEFDTVEECREWVGSRVDSADYYCVCFNQETYRIAFTGWLA